MDAEAGGYEALVQLDPRKYEICRLPISRDLRSGVGCNRKLRYEGSFGAKRQQPRAAQGWTNILVTNHVPEVKDILENLQLRDRLTQIFCSAELGIEKPHPDFFPGVIANLEPYGDVWMIGDSEEADITPARLLGLRTINRR